MVITASDGDTAWVASSRGEKPQIKDCRELGQGSAYYLCMYICLWSGMGMYEYLRVKDNFTSNT